MTTKSDVLEALDDLEQWINGGLLNRFKDCGKVTGWLRTIREALTPAPIASAETPATVHNEVSVSQTVHKTIAETEIEKLDEAIREAEIAIEKFLTPESKVYGYMTTIIKAARAHAGDGYDPSKFVLVPREPTEAMINAFNAGLLHPCGGYFAFQYAAMIAAHKGVGE